MPSSCLGEGRAQRDDGQHQREGCFVGAAQAIERPASHWPQDEHHDNDEDGEFTELNRNRPGFEAHLMRREADGQHEQRQHIREDGGADGNGDGWQFRQARIHDDGIGDQGVRGEQRADQERADGAIPEKKPHDRTGNHRYAERDEAEQEGLVALGQELPEVDLEPDKEHQQELAELGEEIGHLAVLGHNSEAVRPDEDAGQNVADDRRDMEAPRDVGDEQQEEQNGAEARHRR